MTKAEIGLASALHPHLSHRRPIDITATLPNWSTMPKMLKVVLFALGTRGDVQPYAALAQALQSAGHQPLLITAGDFSNLAGEAGVPSLSLPGDVHATLEDPAFKLLFQQGRFVAIQLHLASVVRGHAAKWAITAAEAAPGHDLIIAGLGGFFLAQTVADKLAIPLVQAHLVPISTTRAFAAPVAPAWLDRAGGFIRAGSYATPACRSRCTVRANCTAGSERRIKRLEHEEVIDAMQARLDRWPNAMRVRPRTVEHVFGTLKDWMGRSHFKTRTLKHVGTEASLHILAYNIKRAIALIGTTGLIVAMAA